MIKPVIFDLVDIFGCFPEELADIFGFSPRFRGEQLFREIHKNGKTNFSQITVLPKKLRQNLIEDFRYKRLVSIKTSCDSDNTQKTTFSLYDKKIIEAVLLKNSQNRATACLSTQVGCARACAYCLTGQSGLKRNLSAGEIVGQYLALKNSSSKIDNLVFMGMGEPLDNLAAVVRATEILTHSQGAFLSPGRITVSTCGIIAGIKYLADSGPAVRLAVSLNCANEKKRNNIMPVNTSNGLDELKNALLFYQKKRKKRLTLEYVMISGFNDQKKDAQALRAYVKGLKVLVNLIPLNKTRCTGFVPALAENSRRFERYLNSYGIKTTRRLSKGQDIGAACGQLAVS